MSTIHTWPGPWIAAAVSSGVAIYDVERGLVQTFHSIANLQSFAEKMFDLGKEYGSDLYTEPE